MSTMLGAALDRFSPQDAPGPFVYKGLGLARLTAGTSKILSAPGVPCQLGSVIVNSADPATIVNLYEGTNRSGSLIASIKCSKMITFPFNFRVAKGLFVSVDGGAASVTVATEAVSPNTDVLTIAGNALTDATRAANADGDALGITSVTNQCINGGFENGTTGWVSSGTGVVTVSQEKQISRFGTKSLKVTTDGSSTNQGVKGPNTPAVKGQVWSVSCYVRGPSGATGQLVISERDSGASQLATSVQAVTFDGTWQRVKVDGYTLTNASTTQISSTFNTGGSSQAVTFYLDGYQYETASASHDYVDTSGSVSQMVYQTPDSSYGAWEARTNLFRRGQCDATTDWTQTGAGTTTIATDASQPPIFSLQSIKVTTDGLAASQGVKASSATGQAAAAASFGAGSIWFKGVSGAAYSAFVAWVQDDASTATGTATSFNATGDWQLLTPAAVAVGAGRTGDVLSIRVTVSGTRAENFWVAHAMLEAGTGIISPYVATSGGATSTKTGVQITVPKPTAIFPSTGFWIAGRFRIHWDDAASQEFSTAHNLRFFELFIDSNNKLNVTYNRGASVIASSVVTAGVATGAATAYVPGFGNVLTVCAYFGDRHAIAVNGGAFSAGATGKTLPPWTDAAFANLGGSNNGGTSILGLQGEVLWFAAGRGALTDTDSATINGFGSTDKLPADFPGSCTMVWPANTSRYYTP